MGRFAGPAVSWYCRGEMQVSHHFVTVISGQQDIIETAALFTYRSGEEFMYRKAGTEGLQVTNGVLFTCFVIIYENTTKDYLQYANTENLCYSNPS